MRSDNWVDAAQILVWTAALGDPEPATKAMLAVLGVGLEIYELYRDKVLNAGTTVGNINLVVD